MDIVVKLYGTLAGRHAGYDAAHGLQVQMDDGASLKDLYAWLKLADGDGCFATVAGRVLQADEAVPNGSCVCIFQWVFGG